MEELGVPMYEIALQIKTPALYILTDILPWEDDGTRFGEGEFRETMQRDFADLLLNGPQEDYSIRVIGGRGLRKLEAIEAIDHLLATPFDWPPTLGQER